MLKDGKPSTVHPNGFVDDALIDQLSKRDQIIALRWIDNYLCGGGRTSLRNSYGLKHILERDTGLYLTNNQFKDAMLRSGYAPTIISANELNWEFVIDNDSPAFDSAKDGQRNIIEDDIQRYILKHPELA